MKNKTIAGLIALTGVIFVAAVLKQDSPEGLLKSIQLYQVGFITGMSAVMTKFLIKETVTIKGE